MVHSDRIRSKEHKMEHRRFCLNTRKHFCAARMTEPLNKTPRETVDSPSLKIFNSCLDMGLGNLPEQGDYFKQPPEVPSNLSQPAVQEMSTMLICAWKREPFMDNSGVVTEKDVQVHHCSAMCPWVCSFTPLCSLLKLHTGWRHIPSTFIQCL